MYKSTIMMTAGPGCCPVATRALSGGLERGLVCGLLHQTMLFLHPWVRIEVRVASRRASSGSWSRASPDGDPRDIHHSWADDRAGQFRPSEAGDAPVR